MCEASGQRHSEDVPQGSEDASGQVGSERVWDSDERRRRCVVAVGLTGAIGAGKSTALALFAEAGVLTTSADQVVHDLYARPEFIARLVEHFGPRVVDESGRVERRRLGDLVRGEREELRWLEELTHPLVAEEIGRFVHEAPAGAVVVCEVPLLFESGYEDVFDLIVTVEAAQAQRLRRTAHRTPRESFLEFERLQASSEERTEGSDLVFYNDGDMKALRAFVEQTYAQARAMRGSRD